MTATQPDRAVKVEPTPDLVVAEVYPRAWQGEGPSAGVRCAFIRLGGCNLTCGWRRTRDGLEPVPGAWQCDEPQTWHSGAYDLRDTLTRTPVIQIAAKALAAGPELVVITGGEPLLHQDQPGWALLLTCLMSSRARVEVETNGTLIPALISTRITYNVSPKLACSGLPEGARLVPLALRWHAAHRRSVFKFVATSPADVTEAAAIAARYEIPPARVWIMPEGITALRVLEVARAIAPAVMAAGFNFTLRQHVLIYDTDREPRD